jgi:23S rRNA pseudouridine1911/1915/1917 synthase
MTDIPENLDDTEIDDIIDDDAAPVGDTVLEIVLKASSADRLDRALMAEIEGQSPLSRARLQALIEAGHLSLSGQALTDGKKKARAGTYTLTIPAPTSAIPEPQNLNLEVLFEDAHLIVINKPAGMAAHPAPGTPDGTLVNAQKPFGHRRRPSARHRASPR